jgi:purine-binding chemotaxis protein CheW
MAAEQEAVQLCSVRVGAGLYGVDTRAIREVLGNARPQRVPLAPSYLAGVLTYRGEVLETVSLRTLLGLEGHSGAHHVLVLESPESDERFGLLVDRVGSVVSASQAALEPNPSTLDPRGQALLSGIYRMETALMARLDPARLRPTELAKNPVFTADLRTGHRGAR